VGLFELFILAVGLSMDAFAVSVCKGLAVKEVKFKHSAICGAWFGGFQALMPLIGFFLGSAFEKYVFSFIKPPKKKHSYTHLLRPNDVQTNASNILLLGSSLSDIPFGTLYHRLAGKGKSKFFQQGYSPARKSHTQHNKTGF